MSYIQFKVRSGGIYIRQDKGFSPIKLDIEPHPEDEGQKVLSLVRESAIKGLFAYLMGETQKIKKVEGSQEPAIQKLNKTLDKIVQVVAIKKISEPYITTFFERKDTHSKKSSFSDNPKVNLNHHPFEHADPTIKLLEKPLKSILESAPLSLTLSNIHSFFKESVIQEKNEEEYGKLKEEAFKLSQSVDDKIPESQLKKGIKTALKRITDEKPISIQVLSLIKRICDLCDLDNEFCDKIKQKPQRGKFSIFTDLKNTKHWIYTQYHSVVRGTPAFIACVDFDIYLSQEAFEESQNPSWSWEDIVKKLRAGPGFARWGEGGLVFVHYEGLEEMGRGYNTKDPIFVEIGQLRRAGIKIKKYEWEKTSKEAKHNESKAKQ